MEHKTKILIYTRHENCILCVLCYDTFSVLFFLIICPTRMIELVFESLYNSGVYSYVCSLSNNEEPTVKALMLANSPAIFFVRII